MDASIMKRILLLLTLFLVGILIVWFVGNTNQSTDNNQPAAETGNLPVADEGFSRALDVQPLIFPQDHGPHPDFQTEWWYYTGNLQAEDGHRFGYQLTFFRRALQPVEALQDRPSNWRTSQVYMAHFALSDIDNQDYQAFERLSRSAAGLSGARATPFKVWLQDWSVEETGSNERGFSTYELYAAQDDIELRLTLDDLKGPILQGEQGFSRKGPEAGQASYYYSFTRLDTTGSVAIGDKRFSVQGYSWMDHEFSTSVLSQDQVGWDWFSIQMEDGSELMVFQIRKADGSIDPFSSGTFVSEDGTTTPLSQKDFNIVIKESWQSPHTKALYPASWEIEIPKLDLKINVEPHMPDQELNLSYSYWEGAVKVTGQRAGNPILGNGYVELTGYSGSMGGEF